MLSLSEIKEICAKAFQKGGYNLDDYNITISINGRLTRTFGRCKGKYINFRFVPYAIEISKQLIETCADTSVIEVIYHECAHALVDIETGEHHGHDKVFKDMCKRIGAAFDTSKSQGVERVVSDTKIYKYFIICEGCGKVCGKYHRAGKIIKNIEYYHCKCGGQLKVVQNY